MWTIILSIILGERKVIAGLHSSVSFVYKWYIQYTEAGVVIFRILKKKCQG